jgi:acyl carrier protein
METAQQINTVVRQFIIDNIFAGVDDGQVKDDTSLIKTRTMDSIVALKLVSHLEEKFGIEFEAHEVDQDNLDTIAIIVAFVQKKMK